METSGKGRERGRKERVGELWGVGRRREDRAGEEGEGGRGRGGGEG